MCARSRMPQRINNSDNILSFLFRARISPEEEYDDYEDDDYPFDVSSTDLESIEIDGENEKEASPQPV